MIDSKKHEDVIHDGRCMFDIAADRSILNRIISTCAGCQVLAVKWDVEVHLNPNPNHRPSQDAPVKPSPFHMTRALPPSSLSKISMPLLSGSLPRTLIESKTLARRC
jgi:hypothetical protein